MRPIDADELLKKALPTNPDAQYHCVSVEDIKAAPTIEPEPPKVCEKCIWMQQPERKTGRWVVTPDGRLACSNCLENPTNRIIINGNLVYDMTPIRKRMRYCPNCGADMREEGGE